MSIKMLVVDDHEVVRRGLEAILDGADIDIVAEARDGAEAVALTKKHKPDVVLMDIRMPDDDGLAALDAIHKALPKTKVVMHSMYDNPTYIARSVALGATDYVLKDSGRKKLIAAIRSAAAGREIDASSEMHRVADAMKARKRLAEADVPLTNRESQVLRHVALGLSNKEIGQSLAISVETVKEHVQNILRKVQATDRTQAAVWALKNEVV